MVICPNPRCRVSYPVGTAQCTNPFCLCLLPEAIVAGRYRIETLIGLGGMGAVYRARDTFEMRQVALKVISTVGSLGNPDISTAVERFRREARYVYQLRHNNIVPILNFGQDGPLLYIVMPLITGGTLKSLLKGERPLPLALTQRYLNELADAIDAIHAHPQQIVHRDIKPSNLLIHQDDGRLVVADFGIARAMQREHALTQRGWSVGTEHYAAPEQEHGRALPASDIYSMSVVAYQMLTGMLPVQAVVQSHAAELPMPSQLNPAVPEAVDAVIERAMDIEPAKRYASAKAFAEAFNNALAAPPSALAPSTHLEDLPTVRINLGNDNILVRTITPENTCVNCGQENRSSSRFCRHCGHGLDETSPTIADMCQVGYTSDKGQRSDIQENEDMLLIVQGLCVNLALPRPFGLFAVADGLRGPQGKSAGGHEASRLAVDTIADVLLPPLTISFPSSNSMSSTGFIKKNLPTSSAYALPTTESIIEQLLRDAVRQANKVIYHCNADYETTMASTLTVTLLHEHILYVASFGDSRAYHYNATTGLRRVTTEHALQADAPKPGTLSDSPGSNLHYRYLGLSSEIQIDTFRHPVEANDLILLCTDGLWKMVSDAMLQQMLAQSVDKNPQEIAPLLVDAANNAGGKGNVSAIVVRIL